MGPLDVLKQSSLTDEAGWVTINKDTMQHTTYPNVFALGDNTNAPTSKTAAAICKFLLSMLIQSLTLRVFLAAQSNVLEKNLKAVMAGKEASVEKVK